MTPLKTTVWEAVLLTRQGSGRTGRQSYHVQLLHVAEMLTSGDVRYGNVFTL